MCIFNVVGSKPDSVIQYMGNILYVTIIKAATCRYDTHGGHDLKKRIHN